MPLLEEILAWAQSLPAWQQDSLRRIFQGAPLSETDLGEILAMVKDQAAGVDARQPGPLRAMDIPQLGPTGATTMLAVRDMEHVNGFPSGRSIEFEPEGLTVVFGENGAGKSGYARVLKQACRARRSTPVLPNAFTQGNGRRPSAELIFLDARERQTAAWRDQEPSDARLARVSVYDSACGSDYIDAEGPCAFQPYGLAQLQRLGAAQRELQTRVDRERQSIRIDATSLATLQGDHAVGRILSRLAHDTDLETLRQLAVVTPEQLARIAEVKATLQTMDVEAEARRAETLAQRLAQVLPTVELAQRFTDDRALARAHDYYDARVAALQADSQAQRELSGVGEDAEASTGGEAVAPPLTGTGNAAWKLLFKAAEDFSREFAYPSDHDHPSSAEGARCVLCQTALAPDARERIDRFRRFVRDRAAATLAQATEALASAMGKVDQADLRPIDPPTLAELRVVDSTLADSIELTTAAWQRRRTWIQERVATGDWTIVPPLLPPGVPLADQIRTKVDGLGRRASELRGSRDKQQLEALGRELAELTARRDLGDRFGDVERIVAEMQRKSHLDSVYSALDTRALSTKVTQLSSDHVNQALLDRTLLELSALGYRNRIQPALTARTDRGSSLVTLRLDNTRSGPSEILSEGEQRAMGLALFLAEAGLRGDNSTLVFDDPSTSFDHRHRQRMARHLVKLSNDRQIIVFTHDAVFLSELQLGWTDGDLPIHRQTIEWDENQPGKVLQGLSWENAPAKDQLRTLGARCDDLERVINAYQNDADKKAMREVYGQLRGAIERVVRETVLNDAVHPFSPEIKVDRVGAVTGFSLDEWTRLVEVHDKCSDILAGHDTSGDRQQELPSPAELRTDLAGVIEVHDACDSRRGAFNKGPREARFKQRKELRK